MNARSSQIAAALVWDGGGDADVVRRREMEGLRGCVWDDRMTGKVFVPLWEQLRLGVLLQAHDAIRHYLQMALEFGRESHNFE